MANSLMELYGGGMAGKSNNYQLGGRIARAKRGSEYQGEMRTLGDKAKKAAKAKRKAGFLGSVGSFIGGTLGSLTGIPGAREVGAGLGRYAGESTYAKTDFGGGKYAQQTRGELTEGEKDFRKGMGERALVASAQAAVMPKVYDKAGSWLKGLGGAEEAAAAAQRVGRGSPHITTTDLVDPTKVFPTGGQAAMLPQDLGAVTQAATEGLGAYTGTAAQNLSMARELGLDLTGGQTVMGAYQGAGYGPWSTAMETYGDLFGRGGGLIDYTIPKMAGGGMTSQHGYSGVTADPMGAKYGYGTAIDPMGALKQMGMAGITHDPRFQKYMGDLPQWAMGYEQKLGDVRTGAQQNLMSLASPTAPAATSFAGAGAPALAQQQARQGITQQYGTQRRGITEGYQADVLEAVRDIERKGEFEFQSPWEAAGMTEQEWRNKTRAEQDKLAADAAQLYSSEGNYGLLDPTQGQTGTGTTTTGTTGTNQWTGMSGWGGGIGG